jgi:hypothetical protein
MFACKRFKYMISTHDIFPQIEQQCRHWLPNILRAQTTTLHRTPTSKPLATLYIITHFASISNPLSDGNPCLNHFPLLTSPFIWVPLAFSSSSDNDWTRKLEFHAVALMLFTLPTVSFRHIYTIFMCYYDNLISYVSCCFFTTQLYFKSMCTTKLSFHNQSFLSH